MQKKKLSINNEIVHIRILKIMYLFLGNLNLYLKKLTYELIHL